MSYFMFNDVEYSNLDNHDHGLNGFNQWSVECSRNKRIKGVGAFSLPRAKNNLRL